MDRRNIEKIANTNDEKMLLAKLWDKISAGMKKSIPVNTGFLTQHELTMARYLFGEPDGLYAFGGYEDAERKMLCYLPEYLEETSLYDDGPIVCLRGVFHHSEELSHRDVLGSLMGLGITRETIGDICISQGSFDIFVTEEISPFLLQNFISAGRVKFQISQIPLTEATIPQPEFKEIRDTLASLRLDSLISAGFQVGRSSAVQYITSGKASIDGSLCEKADKAVAEGNKISVRGLGKIKLERINGQTKKGRISVIIHRYI